MFERSEDEVRVFGAQHTETAPNTSLRVLTASRTPPAR
jgi:hypothetical protein